MIILAIETSCDDTSVALIEARKKKRASFNILSNVVSSQVEIHKKWGGVYPALALREHQKNLVPVLHQSLKKARLLKKSKQKKIDQKKLDKIKTILKREEKLYKELKKFIENYEKPEIDLIAVTNGPGLEPCLWVGTNFARALSYFWKLPIVPVNHIESHIFANWLNSKPEDIKFPAICLVVSGGHTQLILMKGIGDYKIIGETRDDAAGECFDKVARILNLDYPGGPIIAQKAQEAKENKYEIELPRPMINTKDYDFSFSGLKTAALYEAKKKKRKSKEYVQEMAKEVQQSIIDVLIKKTIKAAKNYGAKTIILGGGVSSNKELCKQIKKEIKKELPKTQCLIPKAKHCTDNAAMAAINGYYQWQKGKKKSWQQIKVNANLEIGKRN